METTNNATGMGSGDGDRDGAKRRAMFEALHRETSEAAVAFRDYWRKEGEFWAQETKFLRSVVRGETTVSDAVVESGRVAIMRLHQIRYVIGELMLLVGAPSPGVLEAVMDIVKRVEDDMVEAVRNLKQILEWQAAARIQVE